MPLVNVTQFGEKWRWGFGDSDAPSIVSGYEPVEADVKYEPEKVSTSENGEGHVDSVTVSKKEKRKGTSTFTGKVTSDYDPANVPESFPWNNRLWIVTNVGDPRKKGDYHDVQIEATSYALVTE
jgi:hypothetical protein